MWAVQTFSKLVLDQRLESIGNMCVLSLIVPGEHTHTDPHIHAHLPQLCAARSAAGTPNGQLPGTNMDTLALVLLNKVKRETQRI